ncbi:DoxX-like family protein [Sphingobacteriaceae bacterium]|nr:DoxX-like family protein [Sphingobacteriaceae bacterium]
MKTETNRSNKVNKILYWIFTGFISFGFLMSAYMYLSQNPELMSGFAKIGLPVYMVTILGCAKLLGAVAILNPWFPKLKEWAYAGYTFVLIGATWTHVSTGTPFVAPLVFLLLTGLSYFFWQKVREGAAEQTLASVKA